MRELALSALLFRGLWSGKNTEDLAPGWVLTCCTDFTWKQACSFLLSSCLDFVSSIWMERLLSLLLPIEVWQPWCGFCFCTAIPWADQICRSDLLSDNSSTEIKGQVFNGFLFPWNFTWGWGKEWKLFWSCRLFSFNLARMDFLLVCLVLAKGSKKQRA